MKIKTTLVGIAMLTLGAPGLGAEDWPEYRGKGRLGVWNETGILEKFPPASGLKVLWRTPIRAGYSGPAVADGRVFVTDFTRTQGMRGFERILALEEETGRILWTRQWEADYRGISWDEGPRATPTVDGDRVFVQGTMGALVCLDVKMGEILWQWDYVKDYGVRMETWGWHFGFASGPLVDGDRVIAMVGGEPNAKVVAFDKMTGKEIWRALPSDWAPGVGQPIIIEAGGTRQLIIWHPQAVVSLDPVTGNVYWEQPFRVEGDMTVAVPVQSGSQLFLTTFYNGPLMLALDDKKPGARVLWKGKSDSEILTDGLHAVLGTPILEGNYIYGLCSYGQLRSVNATTGQRIWETQAVTKERRRWVSGFIVRYADRVFINNDRGELVLARLTPEGYHEISRAPLIKPTSRPGNRRELGGVSWVHPAYANKHIYMRNDEEIISVTLAASDYH